MAWRIWPMWFIRVVAPLAGLVLFRITPQLLAPSPPGLDGFHSPVIALELVENEQQVRDILAVYEQRNPQPAAEQIRREIQLDNWVIIPVYTLLFLAFSLWLSGSDRPRARALVIALVAGAVGAAASDLAENASILAALESLSQPVVDSIRQASLVKWALLAVLIGLLAVPFLTHKGWVRIVGLLYLLAGVVGLGGVLWQRPLLEWFFALMGLALLPSGEAIRAMTGSVKAENRG